MSKINYLDDVSLKNMFPDGKLTNDKIIVIDVRSPGEVASEYIAGSQNLPLDEIEAYDKNEFKDKTIVFHCKGGVRTRNNQHFLEQFASIASYCMNGGIEQWKNCGYEVKR